MRRLSWFLALALLTGGFATAASTGAPAGAGEIPIPDVEINEIRVDQTGTDNDEYFELAGAATTSLNDLTYLVLGDGTTASGVIESVTSLAGQAIAADGFFLVAETTFTGGTPDLSAGATGLNFENTDNVTHLLVAGFSGANGQDLDTNDDGTLDTTPWTALVDGLALVGTTFLPTANTEFPYSTTTVGPDGTFHPGHVYRCDDTFQIGGFAFDTDDTPGAANGCVPTVDCGTDPVPIHDIQSNGEATTCSGDDVTTGGIVTSLYTDDDALAGVFLQAPDDQVDANVLTSEGIFVLCGANCAGAKVGDAVTASGIVAEAFGSTRINATGAGDGVTVDSTGNTLPTPASIDLPAAAGTNSAATFEQYESMLAKFTDTLAVSEYFQLARFGQLELTADARAYQFTHDNVPSVAGFAAHLADLATKTIVLDDDNDDENDAITGTTDEAYPYPEPGLSTTNFFRGGDTITNLTGVLDWSFGQWRVRPTPSAFDYTFSSVNDRPEEFPGVAGDLRITGFNVLNYFTTINEEANVCGPSSLECRGAHSAEELTRQRAKTVAALTEIDPAIAGLTELENNDTASLQSLVDGLNAAEGSGTYAFIDTGVIGTDAIKVGFIYQPALVTPVGDFKILNSAVDPDFIDTRNRPTLIQTFEEVATGARLTVAINHLKSKGSACADIGDPDLLDGQANCSQTRKKAAQALADYLATDPTGSGDDDFLIIGDLNAYASEEAITTLETAGYTNLSQQFVGDDAYSFLFDGQLGYLDHALANSTLTSQVAGVTEWHINADEVVEFDYNDELQTGNEATFERESAATTLYEALPIRTSDHDPVVVGLDLIPPPVDEAQPDVMVRRGTSLPFVGNDVYFPTVQKVTTNVPGNSQTFQFKIQNDGAEPASFTLEGTAGVPRIGVKYKIGSTQVTDQIVAGTYGTPLLAPGASITITVDFKVQASVPNGTKFGITLEATDATLSDQARAVVKVT